MIVVDASVALKWVLEEEGTPQANALLGNGEVLAAPALWLTEAANGLWKRVSRSELAVEDVVARLDKLAQLDMLSVAVEPLLPAALRLAAGLRHPVYDCIYLALALGESTYVTTADRRFRDATAAAHPGRVRLLVQT